MTIVSDFVEEFQKTKPIFARELSRAYETEKRLFEELAEPMLSWAAKSLGKEYREKLITGYCKFVVDVNRSQMRYEKTKRYEFSSYEEVYKMTYDAPEFMDLYHWGVYTTTFAWLHHLELYRFFRDQFLERHLSKNPEGRLIDLGTGSGVWTFLTLNRFASWSATAIDISEPSLSLTQSMSRTAAPDSSVTFEVGDALQFRDDSPFDAGVSCFLLEHLEHPGQLLVNLAANLKPRAYAFVTGALTAAEIDHIFEFKRESELVRLAEDAGFRVIQTYSSSPYLSNTGVHYLPRSMALIMQKRENEIW